MTDFPASIRDRDRRDFDRKTYLPHAWQLVERASADLHVSGAGEKYTQREPLSFCYSVSNSFQAPRIVCHLERSNFPSFRTSTNALNVLTNARKRRIHSSSPSLGRANTGTGKKAVNRAKHMRRVNTTRYLVSRPVTDECMLTRFPLRRPSNSFTPCQRDKERVIVSFFL